MTLNELKKSIKTLEDIGEIQNMHRAFFYWLNDQPPEERLDNEYEDILGFFADSAIVDIGDYGVKKGKEKIARLLKEIAARNSIPRGRQLSTQPILTVKGNKASGYWNMIHFTNVPATPWPVTRVSDWVQGKYDCEYVREGGKWKFNYLKLTCPWPGWPERKFTPLPRPV